MPKEKGLEVDGVVTEALANTRFRVQLETGHKIIAHVAGRMRKHFIRIVPGDKGAASDGFTEGSLGRGEVINQQALYNHLMSRPAFRAGIDTWWSEPVSQGNFTLEYPFCKLLNFIGSPHNADHVPGSIPHATRLALENVKHFLLGEDIRGVLDRNDYLNLK